MLQRAEVVEMAQTAAVVVGAPDTSRGIDCHVRLPSRVAVEVGASDSASLAQVQQAAGAWS